jgi:hypothetical protein
MFSLLVNGDIFLLKASLVLASLVFISLYLLNTLPRYVFKIIKTKSMSYADPLPRTDNTYFIKIYPVFFPYIPVFYLLTFLKEILPSSTLAT